MRFWIDPILKWLGLTWQGSGVGRQPLSNTVTDAFAVVLGRQPLKNTVTVERPGDRFTDRLKAILLASNEEARKLHQDYVGTEHLLLSLMTEVTSVNANALKKVVGDTDRIQSELKRFLIGGPDLKVANGPLPLTPRAARAIGCAKDVARNLQSNTVDAEHLLLGLLRDTKGVPCRLFLFLGVDPEAIRSELLVALSAGRTEK